MVYAFLCDLPDGWVDRAKVKAKIDSILASSTGEGDASSEAAMLALAGGMP